MARAKAIATRGVYLELGNGNGNDGTSVAVQKLQLDQLERGINPGKMLGSGGFKRSLYAFITDEAWPEVEALLKKRGRL